VLLRDHVGPLLKREEVGTQIMLGEAPTRERAARGYPIILDDPVTRNYVAILPYHGHDRSNFDKIAVLHQHYPQFHSWMTKLCYHSVGLVKPIWTNLPWYNFDDDDYWGNVIFNDLEATASAWIYWNLFLNEHGGPWSVSVIHGNPDPNVQQPVVIIDGQTKKVTYTGVFYYLAHFSKFVRPGAVRLQTVGSGGGALVMSFESPDGKIVTELMNSNKSSSAVNLGFHGQVLHLELPAVSFTTAMWSGFGKKQDTARRSVAEITPQSTLVP
jgi:glucosylceramidase